MSYQKTKRVQSPIKGKFYSMIRRENQPQSLSILSSQLTQKRKPIFNDTPQRSQFSTSSPSRKKIFTNRQKTSQSLFQDQISKFTHTSYLESKHDHNQGKQLSIQKSDSSSSSSIGSNEGLEQIRKKLFPSTPINRISHNSDLMEDMELCPTNSWKQILFHQSDEAQKSIFSMSTNNVEKTLFKIDSQTPLKYDDGPTVQQKIQQSSYKVRLKFQTPPKDNRKVNNKVFYSENVNINEPRRDLAKQIRQIHESLTKKNLANAKANNYHQILIKENEMLKKQNQRLKEKFQEFQKKIKN